MRHLLGVDIGSFSAKGVVLDEEGSIIATAQRKHEMRVPGPGLAEHDAEADWWDGFRLLSRRLIDDAGIDPVTIAAVGTSGIGPCALPIDGAGRPIRPAILYGVDTRASREIAELDELLGADRVFERTGNPLTAQSVGPKIRWLQRHEPDVCARTRRIVGCPTFLVYRLTGRHVVDHYGASCYTPCYDLATRGWANDLLEGVCPVDWLPEIGWTTDIAGTVTTDAAAATGLAAGTPVIVGTIDAAAEAISVGVGSPGDLMIMYGTTAFFIQVNDRPAVDRRCWAAPFLFPEGWVTMGGIATGGALTEWFRSEFAQLGNEASAFERLVEEAAVSPPGANGLIVLPYFSGERTPINNPLAKGMFFGLTLAHHRGDLYRAVIEGIGHAVRHNLDTFAEVAPARRVYAVGGGVKNPLWTQCVSDISGVVQAVRTHTIGASLGSAFLAGVGACVFDRDDIETINPVRSVVSPRAELRDRYDADHAAYLMLYERTRDLMAGR
jgi:xylulokinase